MPCSGFRDKGSPVDDANLWFVGSLFQASVPGIREKWSYPGEGVRGEAKTKGRARLFGIGPPDRVRETVEYEYGLIIRSLSSPPLTGSYPLVAESVNHAP